VTTDLEKARAAYEAFGRGDVETLSQWFDPAVEWVEPPELPGARAYHGRERVAEYLESILRVWEEFAVEPKQFDERPDGFLVPIHIRAVARRSGVRVEHHVVHRITMRDGKATRVEVFQSFEEAERVG
jgi:ketosteroid isomerase-like protein